jgi:hypothetical protein
MKYKKDLEGCVYFFLKNYNPPNKNKPIHKLVDNSFFVSNELTNVHKINMYRDIFYVCESSSELHMKTMDDYDSIYENYKIDDSILLEFEDRELIYLKSYLKALSSSKKYIFTIINFYKKLLHSIHLLVNNKLVHNHIHFDSIVIDNFDNPLLSNFTFSIDISRKDMDQYIKHFIIEFDPTYIEWPIEFHILAYLLTNKLDSLSSYNIETIIEKVVNNHTILQTFGKDVVSSYKLEATHYFKKFVNRSYEYILTDVLQYSYTWDNYALSIMFLRILIGVHRTIRIKNKFIILFMKLLVSNIHLSPLKRLSIEETIIQFESILDNIEIKEYKDVIDNLMSV